MFTILRYTAHKKFDKNKIYNRIKGQFYLATCPYDRFDWGINVHVHVHVHEAGYHQTRRRHAKIEKGGG